MSTFWDIVKILFKVEANDIITLNSSSDQNILSELWGKDLTNSNPTLEWGEYTPITDSP